MERIIIGLIEKIRVNGKETLAKIDTGADRSSMDFKLAAELNLGPIVRTTRIKTAHGRSRRPVIKAEIELKTKKIKAEFNLTDRSNMRYPVLLGKKILKLSGFLIDPNK